KILSEVENNWQLEIPAYRTDVQREADVVEEILRIYGYNEVEIPEKLNASLSYFPKPDREKFINLLANFLTSLGFHEIMNNSMTNPTWNEKYPLVNSENVISLANPLSSELQMMRPSMVFQTLETVYFNQNRKENNLKFFEFGKSYTKS